MENRKLLHLLIVAFIGMIVFIAGFFFFYNRLVSQQNDLINNNNTRDGIAGDIGSDSLDGVRSEDGNLPNEDVPASQLEPHVDIDSLESIEVAVNPGTVKSYTKMVYQYYYEVDDKLVETVTHPPYYYLNLTREQLAKELPDWQIQSFSGEEIVLRKYVQDRYTEGYYMIGVHQGYISVFYEDGTLREITQTHVSTLPDKEQEKLREGIKVTGEEELIKILESYTS